MGGRGAGVLFGEEKVVVVEFIAILEGDELNTQDISSLFCSLKKDALHQPTQSIS